MLINRKPRKQIKLKDAMPILQLSRSGIRDQIFKYQTLQIANEKQRRGPTSPIKLFESQVADLAREWGIL